MEDDSSRNTSPAAETELESLQRQHEEKLSRMEELKRKKEAMRVELEKQKNQNPQKMKGLDELREAYNSRRDQLSALLGERSAGNNNCL